MKVTCVVWKSHILFMKIICLFCVQKKKFFLWNSLLFYENLFYFYENHMCFMKVTCVVWNSHVLYEIHMYCMKFTSILWKSLRLRQTPPSRGDPPRPGRLRLPVVRGSGELFGLKSLLLLFGQTLASQKSRSCLPWYSGEFFGLRFAPVSPKGFNLCEPPVND